MSKKILFNPFTMILPSVVGSTGILTVAEPSFGSLASSTCGYVKPPSVDNLISTFVQLTGAAVVPATSQVMVCIVPPCHVVAEFCEVTTKGPIPAAVVTTTSSSSVHPALI